MRYMTLKNGAPFCAETDVRFENGYDVIVAGAGTAGAMAAICAARKGLRVLAVEKMTAPGGMGVTAGVWPYYYGIHAGLSDEINQKALEIQKRCGYAEYDYQQIEQRTIGVPSAPKCVAIEEELQKSGCELWCESTVSGVFVQNGRIAGLEIISRGRRVPVACKTVIDSADAAVCRLAGCEITTGRSSDNAAMSFSKQIGIANGRRVRTDCTFCGYIDDKNPEDYSRLILRAGANEPCLHEDYSRRSPVIFEASVVGKREVRSVNARYTDSLDNFLDGNFSEKPVFYTFAPFDNSNGDIENENEAVKDWRVLINATSYGLSVGVDMESLVSKEYENLFLAGKHIGVGRDLIACTRMKYDIEKSGEAAALMAAQLISDGALSYEKLRPELLKRGFLNCPYPIGYASVNRMISEDIFEPAVLPKTAAELTEVLSGKSPETAFMYARRKRNDPELLGLLIKNLESENIILRDNSAICLGLLGDKRCLSALRDMLRRPAYVLSVREYEPYYFPWLTDTEHCNALKAVCLIERFADSESYDIMSAIADDNAEYITSKLSEKHRGHFSPIILAFVRKYLEKL